MRICVVLPGDEFLSAAGVRIRYRRIGARLAEQGHELTLALIDGLQILPKPRSDVYIISKCYDARGLMLAADLRAQGLRVGIDIFDDYYSQTEDSRFVHLRRWLREIANDVSFALCSTPLMLANLQKLLPRLPCHMMNDPFDELDTEKLADLLQVKLQRARSTRIIDIAWFGAGENGYFPVGLSDVAAFGHRLAGLSAGGLKPRLSILTNRRALTADNLQALGRLPLPWRIEEWSEEAEAHLVSESYACFLPVNAQRFSIVKSLNRAVTALSGGMQVLSAGFPLYKSFEKLIYREAAALSAGITKDEPRLQAGTLPLLARILGNHASPERVATGLLKFLGTVVSPPPAKDALPAAILHGRLSTASIHKYAQRKGHLSVAGPRPAALNYDVRIASHPETGKEIILLSTQAMGRLRTELQPLAQSTVTFEGKKVHFLPLDAGALQPCQCRQSALMEFDAVFLANYSEDMSRMRALLAILFGDMPVIISESASPFWEGPGRTSASAA